MQQQANGVRSPPTAATPKRTPKHSPRHRRAPPTPPSSSSRSWSLEPNSFDSPLISQILIPSPPSSLRKAPARAANPHSTLLLTSGAGARPSSALHLRTAVNAKEVQARGLYPACAAAQSATEEEDPPWQPKRTWNSPLQHFEDTATYDRRYVGRLVSPTSWSPRLALAMTRGGGHVEGWPRAAWQPSPRATPELRARLSAEGVRQADKPPRPPGEILAEMDAQAARWEAESDLKAIYARATAATEAHRSVVSNYDEWWAEYQIRRDETLRLAAAARAAELDAIDQASARREREERDAAEAMKAELEQRRKQRMAEAARVDAMMAAQKAEMEEMRKAAARERLAKEREKAEREAERKGAAPSRPGAA
jgi:hypothetical protein